jgi:hypothetical protein
MTTLVRPDGSAIASKLKESKPAIPTKPKDISKMLEKVPEPTGWRILVRPYMPPAKTKGGVFVSDESQERIAVATVCALVLKMVHYVTETKINSQQVLGVKKASG